MNLPDLSEIKKLREKLGLNQSELSRRTGISQQTISRIENGKRKNNQQELIKKEE